MNETNIGSGGLNKPTELIDTFLTTQPVSEPNASYYVSSMAKSDREAILLNPIASVPHLVSPNTFLMKFESEMYKITQKVLESWSESIQKEAELIKRLINSPAYLAKQEEKQKIASGEDKIQDVELGADGLEISQRVEGGGIRSIDIVDKYAWLQFVGAFLNVNPLIEGTPLSPQKSSTQEVPIAAGVVGTMGGSGIQNSQTIQDSEGNIVGIREIHAEDIKSPKISNEEGINVDEVDLTEKKSSSAAQLLGQLFLIGVGELVLFQGAPAFVSATASGLHTEAMIIQNAWNAVSSQASDNASLVAGWLSALWGIGLVYQTSSEKIMSYGGEKAKKQPEMNIDFAKTYAEKMLGFMPQLTASLQASLAKIAPEKSPQELTELVAKAKIVLLSLSLALLAKIEVGSKRDQGWINELDFAGLLNGATDITQNDLYETASLKRALIFQINTLLAQLNSRVSEQVKGNLLTFMSGNPSVEDMLDQQTAFEKILNQPSFEAGNFDKVAV